MKIDDSDVRVIVSTVRVQAGTRAMFHHVGLDPAEQRILVLKSSVHFRADFGAVVGEIHSVVAPGAAVADSAMLPFRRLRPGVRLTPNGAAFDGGDRR